MGAALHHSALLRVEKIGMGEDGRRNGVYVSAKAVGRSFCEELRCIRPVCPSSGWISPSVKC